MRVRSIKTLFILGIIFSFASCGSSDPVITPDPMVMEEDTIPEVDDFLLPNIDLNNWKVTLPIGNPTEVEPPEILDYANIEILKEFMFNDSVDGSLVFYTYPGASTANSSYSRTELREQMEPGSNSVNWSFDDGGNMKGRLRMDDISKDSDGKYHRAIIMQIHGRLSNDQRDLIGEDDNNAPPVLKIYWNNQRVRVIRKVLKDSTVNDVDILRKEAWTDEGFWFNETVGFDKFELEIKVDGSRMEIILNNNENMVFDDIHTREWAIFENYFKAGNYLNTTDTGSYSRVKYYELEVSH